MRDVITTYSLFYTELLQILLYAFILLYPSTVSSGQIFFWTDGQGVKHYSNVAHSESVTDLKAYNEKNDTERDNDEQYNMNGAEEPEDVDTNRKLSGKSGSERSNSINYEAATFKFRVLKIYDGDSIKIRGAGLTLMLRLIGIDAPESGKGKRKSKKNKVVNFLQNNQNSQPFCNEAKATLSGIIDGKEIRIKSYGTDRYNRLLAEIYTSDGTLVNLEMVKLGMAEVYRGNTEKGFDSSPYLRAELHARNERLGIWSVGSAYQSPKEWRKKNLSN